MNKSMYIFKGSKGLKLKENSENQKNKKSKEVKSHRPDIEHSNFGSVMFKSEKKSLGKNKNGGMNTTQFDERDDSKGNQIFRHIFNLDLSFHYTNSVIICLIEKVFTISRTLNGKMT